MTHPEVENFHIISWKGGGEMSVTMGVNFDEAWRMFSVITDIEFDRTQISRAIRQGRQYYPRTKSIGNLVGIAVAPFTMSMDGVKFNVPDPTGKPRQVHLFSAKPASED